MKRAYTLTGAAIAMMALGATSAQADTGEKIPASDAQASCIQAEIQVDGYSTGCAVWADEFNGPAINEGTWTVYDGYGTDQDPYGKYEKDNASIQTEGDTSYLEVKTEKGTSLAARDGKSVEMTTRGNAAFEGNFHLESRVRTSGDGHQGLYTYGEGDITTQQGELDIYERFGTTDRSTGSGAADTAEVSGLDQSVVHYSGAANEQYGGKTGTKQVWNKTSVGQWTTIAATKTPEGVYFYRDGVQVNFVSSNDPKYQASFPEGLGQHVTITSRVSNSYWGLQENQTGTFDVDYVRVWKLGEQEIVTPPIEVPVAPVEPTTPEDTTPVVPAEPTAPVVDTPVVPETPVDQPAPVVPEAPVDQPAPVVPEVPADPKTPVEETAPAEETPVAAIPEQPIVEESAPAQVVDTQAPAVEETTPASAVSVDTKKTLRAEAPIVESALVALMSAPVVAEDQVADEPVVASQSVASDPAPTSSDATVAAEDSTTDSASTEATDSATQAATPDTLAYTGAGRNTIIALLAFLALSAGAGLILAARHRDEQEG